MLQLDALVALQARHIIRANLIELPCLQPQTATSGPEYNERIRNLVFSGNPSADFVSGTAGPPMPELVCCASKLKDDHTAIAIRNTVAQPARAM